MLEWRLKAYRHWELDEVEGAALAERPLPPIDYQDIIYYSAPEAEEAARQPRRGRSRAAARRSRSSASRSRSRSASPASRSTRSSTSVSVATTFKEKLAEARHHLLLVLRGGARASRARAASTSGSVVPYTDNFFAALNCRGLHRRLVRATSRRACAARWSCRPTSASTRRTPASSSGR